MGSVNSGITMDWLVLVRFFTGLQSDIRLFEDPQSSNEASDSCHGK